MPRKKTPPPDLGPLVEVVVQEQIFETGLGILKPGSKVKIPSDRASQLGKKVKVVSQPKPAPEPIVKMGPELPTADPKKGFNRMVDPAPSKDK